MRVSVFPKAVLCSALFSPTLKVREFQIGPFQATKGDCAKVKVKSRLNLHGIVSVESAQLIEEEEVEVPASNESSNMDMDKAPTEVASTNENDVNM
ncbi:putative Heat shock protein 70kD, peptide-binding domain superfamily [Helianthus anomalus]